MFTPPMLPLCPGHPWNRLAESAAHPFIVAVEVSPEILLDPHGTPLRRGQPITFYELLCLFCACGSGA